jgi:hypothetical protein
MSVACLCSLFLDNFVRSPLLAVAATWPSRDPPCRSGACIHNWTSREPVFAAGEEDVSAQSLNKGLMAQAYL